MRLAAMLLCLAGPALAGPLTDGADICLDPLTTGPEKVAAFAATGWSQSAGPDPAVLGPLALAHVETILGGGQIPLEALFEPSVQLELNFAGLMGDGLMVTFTAEGAVAGLLVAPAPDGGEHLSCFIAALPSGEMEAAWASSGQQPETRESGSEGIILQGMVMNSVTDLTYDEYTIWSRVSAELTPFTDAFRYERIERP